MRLLLLASVLFFAVSGFAQYGYAPSGTYPADYDMKTFTGKLIDFDTEKRIVKLQCDICANQDEFVAVVGDPQMSKVLKFKTSPRDRYRKGPQREKHFPAPNSIKRGDLLRVFYNERKNKQDGEKVKYNAVFEMEMLVEAPPPSAGQ